MLKKLISKVKDWEYWPPYMFYIPTLPYAVYLAIKSKSLVFYSAVNPAIRYSGNGSESKYDTINLIPSEYRPKTILCKKIKSIDQLSDNLKNKNIEFPVVVKPDMGFRGLLVKIVDSIEDLYKYVKKYELPFIIQEFIDLPKECGIFYHRLPSDKKGTISSITLKRFLAVKGDGFHTLEELVMKDNRASRYKKVFKKTHIESWHKVLKKNSLIYLNSIGNHSRGTQYINGNHLKDDQLTDLFDELSKKIKGWYYGRVDIKYKTFEELKQGKNLKILEINGIIAEPTHIYDTNHSTYFDSIKTFIKHWKILFEIGILNNKSYNIPYSNTKKFIQSIIDLFKYTKKIKSFNTKMD